MSILTLPWNLLLLIGIFLFTLLIREVIRVFQLPGGHPERGFAWFNALILMVFIVILFIFGYAVFIHEKRLMEIVPLYPGARYAPERALGRTEENWAFVTTDDPALVEDFYRRMASTSDYTMIVHDQINAKRMLFKKNNSTLFLTVMESGDAYELLYNEKGDRI